MFNLFGGGAPGPPAEPDHTLNAAQLHELHAQYRALSEGHARGLESLMSKLTAENAQVKAKLAAAEDQVRLLKAGRKELTDEMSKLQRQLLVQSGE